MTVGGRAVSRPLALSRLGGSVLVAAVALSLVLPSLGHRIIATGRYNGDDEARSALLARDILDRHAVFDLHYRLESPFRDKPPLFPWLIALCSLPAGEVTETSARAPVALALVGMAVFTYLLGERLVTSRAGLWAALILVTSYDVFGNSQEVLPDMLVVGFATMAGWAFWSARTAPSAKTAMPLFYVAVALAVFAKGPLGLVPFLTAAVWLWTAEGGRQVLPRLWNPGGAAWFAAITLVWVVPFLAMGTRSWVKDSVWSDWLTWYFGVPGRSAGEFIYTVAVGLLPWAPLAGFAIVQAVGHWKQPAVRFALLWFSVPLLVLMLSAHFKPRYSLSVYPGAALLIGWWADRFGTVRSTARRIAGWVGLAGFVALAVSLYVPPWWHRHMRVYLTGLSWELAPIALGLVLIGAFLCHGLATGRPSLLVQGVGITTAVILAYGVWPYTQRYNELWNFRQFAAAVQRVAPLGDVSVFRYRFDEWMSLDFYLRRTIPSVEDVGALREYLDRSGQPVVVIGASEFGRVRAQLPVNVHPVDAMAIGGNTLLIVRKVEALASTTVAADVPGDATSEASTWSPDLRAERATRRLTEVKRQVTATLTGPCPDSSDAWDAWLDRVVSVAATLIAVGDMDGPLKKSGASLERLQAFDDAKGSALTQLGAAEAAKRKIDECAGSVGLTPPSMPELIDRVYDRADGYKQREEAAIGLGEMYRPIKRP
jgi:4-amino-4-deoxy-L-arabinose transferase-like glycosyltransferase